MSKQVKCGNILTISAMVWHGVSFAIQTLETVVVAPDRCGNMEARQACDVLY